MSFVEFEVRIFVALLRALHARSHNYKVTVTLYGTVHPFNGMVVNLVDVGNALKAILAVVDHKHLDLDVAYFRDNHIVSTAENIAVFFWRAMKQFPRLAPLLHEVRVDETDKNTGSHRQNDVNRRVPIKRCVAHSDI